MKLTDTERRLVGLYCNFGMSHREVAREVGLTTWTVRAHVDRARLKLRCRSVQEMIVLVWRHGEIVYIDGVGRTVIVPDVITNGPPDGS